MPEISLDNSFKNIHKLGRLVQDAIWDLKLFMYYFYPM